ncbi:hypothetical protein UFOVP1305_61 [uncultured Caudovirales phage]|uniref:Uncharacterized protein n=1 Tax=uncultured Caudovirales phage TaxID=2100421 RepID=A0A6J5RMM1_9CAUD|nr:hypothetical protein UFOVP896_6 [uncultured Caudovirales phage]CAB4198239.1 hypothetical protein UFOVP1305_61 [uncultured Caudovirales phage]
MITALEVTAHSSREAAKAAHAIETGTRYVYEPIGDSFLDEAPDFYYCSARTCASFDMLVTLGHEHTGLKVSQIEYREDTTRTLGSTSSTSSRGASNLATEKQIDFLMKLITEMVERFKIIDPEVNVTVDEIVKTLKIETLTKSQASAKIETLVTQAKKDKASGIGVKPAVKVKTVEAPVGIHMLDGVIFKVQVAVHGSGLAYAKRLTIVDGTGEWVYEGRSAAFKSLSESTLLTLEQAAEYGHLYGVCGCCGRVLTDEKSIAAGIGPICASKF